MVKEEGPWVTLDKFADLTKFETVGSLLYGKTEEDRVHAYNQLKKASSQFFVYRRKDVPASLEYNLNPREGDPVVVATGPYAIRAHEPPAGKADQAPNPGDARARSAQDCSDESELLRRRSGYCRREDRSSF